MASSTHEPRPRTDRTALQARSFVIDGNETGILLVHGFAGSIADLRVFGERLHTMGGYTVIGVRLAGHGMTVEDLHRSVADDWYASARRGYHILAPRVKRVVVIGESMGALIAFRLSMEYPLIRGVVCVAPALRMGNETMRAIAMVMTPPSKKWKKTWVDDARAQRGSLRAVTSRSYREFSRVVTKERATLKSVSVPVLALFAEGDFVTDASSIEILKSTLPDTQLMVHVVKAHTHHLSESTQVDELSGEINEFIQRCE